MKIKIAMLDDNIDFINYAVQCLNTMKHLNIETFHNEKEFLTKISITHYDVVCMDYDLPTCNGYDIIGSEYLIDTLIILVTHHKSISLVKEGYKHSIFRFITKDMYATEIVEALYDAKEFLMKRKFLSFKVGRETRTFDLNHTLAVYSENHYINIVMDDNTVSSVRKSIKDIAQNLLDNEFARAECNTYVNLRRILYVDKYDVILDNNKHFHISKGEYKELKRRFNEVPHV